MRSWTPGPRLLTAHLIKRNRAPQIRRRWLLAACLGAIAWALGEGFQPELAEACGGLQRHRLIASVTVACLTAAVVASHRAAAREAYARSWLAALPVRPGIARRESLRIELFPAAAGGLAVTAITALTWAVFAAGRGGDATGLLIVWTWLIGAFIVGAMASYGIPAPKVIDLPPGSRYVPQGRSMRGRVLRPSLSALGRWPVRQMFAQANPKLVARALMPVLLCMGLGSTADMAMVAIGLFAAVGALALLIPAVMTVSGAALRWTSPLPLPPATLWRVLTGRSLCAAWGLSMVVGFLLPLLDVAVTAAMRTAVTLALLCTAAILLGSWLRSRVTT